MLLVSTDPASNVGQVFGLEDRQHHHRRYPAVAGSVGPGDRPRDQAADAYRERIIGPVRGLLCRTRRSPVDHRTALRGPAPPRSPRSTSSPPCSPTTTGRTASSITCSSIPPRPGTPSGCCSSPARGPSSSTTARATHPAWDRCRDSTSSARHLRRSRSRALADPPAHPPRPGGPGPAVRRSPRSTRTHEELADHRSCTHQYVVINGVLPIPADDSDALAAAIYERETRGDRRPARRTTFALPSDHRRSQEHQHRSDVDALESLFTTDDRRTRKRRVDSAEL